MMKRVALITSLLLASVVMSASFANAAVTFSVVATASGGDLLAMEVGDTLTLDVTWRSDADVSGENVFAIGAAVFGYEPGSLSLVEGTTSTASLVQIATTPGAGFGGLDSVQLPDERPDSANAIETQFFNGLSTTGTPATGAADLSPVDETIGGPQAQLIYTVNATTDFGVGASMEFGDAVVGDGGAFLDANNAMISIVVPEPGAVASSLAALGSVFAVIGIRRRI
jgi:hypothetical protein